MPAAEVVFMQRFDREAIRQDAARKRRPHDYPEATRQSERQNRLLDAARKNAVLVLQCRYRSDRERPLTSSGRWFEMPPWRTLPSATSSSIAAHVSSIGTDGSRS